MNTGIRQKLHSYMEQLDDRKLRAIYTVMEQDIERASVPFSDAFRKELDRRWKSYKNGTEPTLSGEESQAGTGRLLREI